LGASISIKRDAVGDVVLHEDERTSKLAKRVEVPDERPVGIPANIIAECPERCLQQGARNCLQRELCRSTGRCDTEIASPHSLRPPITNCETGVVVIYRWRWELECFAIEKGQHLLRRSADRCGRANDLRPVSAH